MTQPVKAWLPSSAITKADEEAAVNTIAGQWAGAWFAAARPPRLTRAADLAHRRFAWCQAGEAWAGLEEEEAVNLGLALCAGRADPANPRDRKVLSALAEEACGDLAARFVPDAIGKDASSGPPAPQQVRVGFVLQSADRQWSLGLALGHDALIGTRRRLAASGYLPPLGSLTKALAAVTCPLSIRLGSARLSAADLASLDSGDVIMLDRAMKDELELALAGQPLSRGGARIESASEELRFSIVTPIAGATHKALSV